jgi:hypothetical protein
MEVGMDYLTEKECERIYNEDHHFDHLQEIATVCSKKDGWGMIIDVYSEDHGVLYDKTNPAHAHIKDLDGNLLGKFAITKEKPQSSAYIFDCYKKDGKIIRIPPEYKEKIVRWAPIKPPLSDDDDAISNWGALKLAWRHLHPEL